MSDETRAWRRDANPVALFIAERTRICTRAADETMAERLFAAFRGWCKANGHRIVTSTVFGMRMRDLGKPSRHTRKGSVYSVTLIGSDDYPNETASVSTDESAS